MTVGPHVFYPGQTPTYLTGFVADMVCFGFQWSLLYYLRVIYKRENDRRDREFGPPQDNAGDAFTDLTDRENMSFRCKSSFLRICRDADPQTPSRL